MELSTVIRADGRELRLLQILLSPGIKEAITEIRESGYEVVVVSTRCATPEGYGAVRAWLLDHDIEVDDVKMEKPPAIVYIDDRAICFDGNPTTLLGKIKSFKPWNK